MHDQIIAVPKNGKKTQAALSADLLRRSLQIEHGIHADAHEGYGLALVSVWVGLVVWCDGTWYWWRAGWDDQRICTPAIRPSSRHMPPDVSPSATPISGTVVPPRRRSAISPPAALSGK